VLPRLYAVRLVYMRGAIASLLFSSAITRRALFKRLAKDCWYDDAGWCYLLSRTPFGASGVFCLLPGGTIAAMLP